MKPRLKVLCLLHRTFFFFTTLSTAIVCFFSFGRYWGSSREARNMCPRRGNVSSCLPGAARPYSVFIFLSISFWTMLYVGFFSTVAFFLSPGGCPWNVNSLLIEVSFLHRQAALGEGKGKSEGSNKAVLSVEVDATKVVLGTLYQGKCDQISLDLVFDRDFVVSHTGSSVSMYLCGYRTEAPQDEYPFSIPFIQWISQVCFENCS